jgi:hypothetical protein
MVLTCRFVPGDGALRLQAIAARLRFLILARCSKAISHPVLRDTARVVSYLQDQDRQSFKVKLKVHLYGDG